MAPDLYRLSIVCDEFPYKLDYNLAHLLLVDSDKTYIPHRKKPIVEHVALIESARNRNESTITSPSADIYSIDSNKYSCYFK